MFYAFCICIFPLQPLMLPLFRVSHVRDFLHSFQASKLEKQSSMPESDYDNTFNDSEVDDSG